MASIGQLELIYLSKLVMFHSYVIVMLVYQRITHSKTRENPRIVDLLIRLANPFLRGVLNESCRKWNRSAWSGARVPLNQDQFQWLPSDKHTTNYGTSPFSMGKSTFSMVIFNSYVKLPEGTFDDNCLTCNLRSGKRLRYADVSRWKTDLQPRKSSKTHWWAKRSSPPLQSLEFSHLSFQRGSSEFPPLAELTRAARAWRVSSGAYQIPLWRPRSPPAAPTPRHEVGQKHETNRAMATPSHRSKSFWKLEISGNMR